ncbi:DUF4031 domain-containing protein [Actinocorallia sp. API 0066]|uniref:DUF4031 domain-containing protein n=1 Tax=Actinocorallia sp. API 0066 TaxID=2896846 RepID=UPI001E53888E|nr:DUF4031 domain-containing protein [Actinocorallia sp. API 0066]MCD0448085.1 DUF4031 domain-containing protein [Actinocorallia sp. API 0066]
MALYIDPPIWQAKGLLWSHLISDVSFTELHTFAARLGAPPRAFERDHYDVPEEAYEAAVVLGAREVSCQELLGHLRRSGLRRPKFAARPAPR